jgi:hypothetical protein
MTCTARRPFGLAITLLLALQSLAAHGQVVWERTLSTPSSEYFDVGRVEPLPAGGFRVTGNVSSYTFNGGYFAGVQDFDSDGGPVGPTRLGPLPELRSGRSAAPDVVWHYEPLLPYGDRAPAAPTPCIRTDLGGGLELRFAERVGHSLSYPSFGYRTWLGLDGEGGAFGASAGVIFRHRSDCSVEVVSQRPEQHTSLVNSSIEAFAYGGSRLTGRQPGEAGQLFGFDRNGLRWSIPLSVGQGPTLIIEVLGEVEGDAVVAVSDDTEAALARVTPQGQVLWTLRLGAAAYPWAAEMTGQGLLVSSVRRSDAFEASRVGWWMVSADSGELRWSWHVSAEFDPNQRLAASYSIPHAEFHATRRLGLLSDGSGGIIVELDGAGGASKVSTHGSSRYPRLQFGDGRLVEASGLGLSYALQGDRPAVRHLAVYSREELELGTFKEEALRVPWPQRPRAVFADESGVIVVSSEHSDHRIEAFGPGGAPIWQHRLDRIPLGGLKWYSPQATVQAVGGRVCVWLSRRGHDSSSLPVAPASQLSCFRRSDGEVLFKQAELLDRSVDRPGTLLLSSTDGGGAVAVMDTGCQSRFFNALCQDNIGVVRVSTNGTVVRNDLLLDDAPDGDFDYELLRPLADGRFLVARTGDGLRFFALDLGGQTTDLNALESEGFEIQQSVRLLDGGVAVLLESFGAERASKLLRFHTDGALAWSRTLPGEFRAWATDTYPRPLYEPQFAPQHAYVASNERGETVVLTIVAGRLQLHGLSPEGDVRWQKDIGSGALDSVLGLHLNAEGMVRLAVQRADRVLLTQLAPDGKEAGGSVVAGPSVGGLSWTPEGDAVLVAEGERAKGGSPQPATLRRVRVQQPRGCSGPQPTGFWFDPGSQGQGLFFHPAANGTVLTATWLSFAPDGETDRSDLRWLSLFGEVSENGATALDIQSSRGGAFPLGVAQRTETVGSASLHRFDCDAMALDYTFNGQELSGRSGRIHLVSAVPLGGGSLGGIWYEPSASGQGLLLHGIGSAGNGPAVLVGAWATFDPAGQADDPSAQHWFTLSGERQSDGSYQGDIVRTLGGSFDGQATQNHQRVGRAALRILACDRLQIEYEFEGEPLVGAFGSMQGSLVLERLDGCSSEAKGGRAEP